MKTGIIYLLHISTLEQENLYKIGYTTNSVKSRLKVLKTGNPFIIECLLEYKTENYRKVEKWLHSRYNSKRLEGEWFQLTTKDIKGFIDECRLADDTIKFLSEHNTLYK